ncbi:MAG: pyruvate kinase [Erysipelotrichaceae bacterium]|nr:pyruvate kinase [Erysipelotrichaceae bacterium]
MISKQVKIVATLGPASESYDMILAMAKEGLDIARMNFSHGSYEEHKARMDMVKKVREENDLNIGIMMDTKGPEIRLGAFESPQDYKAGETVKVVKKEYLGDHGCFQIKCPELFDDISVNDRILINDGKISITVIEKNNNEEFIARINNSGTLSSNKGCNVPGVKLTMPFVSEKDYQDICFALDQDVDFIAASFVRRADDVRAIRKILKEKDKERVAIISKIENQEGYNNIADIIAESDGIMVARGDLGMEVQASLVPLYQKRMISLANRSGKFVITATQMLDSMTNNPTCTRAEASDVANAVLDGSDAVMLSGETSVGQYPIETIRTMRDIVEKAESIYPYESRFLEMKKTSSNEINDAIGLAMVDASLNLSVSAIVCFTETGKTARTIAKYRPAIPVIAVTPDRKTMRLLTGNYGIHAYYCPELKERKIDDDTLASEILKNNGCVSGDLFILSDGYPSGSGNTNMMKITHVI